jgi:SAM-dependent methyltransferase
LTRGFLPPAGSALEIGPGGGEILCTLRDDGYRVVGVDIDRDLVGHLRSQFGLEVLEESEAEKAIPPNSQDVAMLWNTFEHVPDPRRVLARIAGWLRPGGHILLSVPNATALERTLFFPRSPCEDIPRHLYSYSPKTLCEMLRSSGFAELRLRNHTTCAVSELRQALADRLTSGRHAGRFGRIAYPLFALPALGTLESVFGLFRRGHAMVASARLISNDPIQNLPGESRQT